MLSTRPFTVAMAVLCAAMIAIVAMPSPDTGAMARSGYIVASS